MSASLDSGEAGMGDDEHPKGTLLFMLIFLVLLTALWINAYMQLWWR